MASNDVTINNPNYAGTLRVAADTFLRNQHRELKTDFLLAELPFNVSDWSGQRLYGGSWL